MESNIPEGLQHQPVEYITSWIANAGFNCVRLTYSIDMALNPNMTVATSFTAAPKAAGVDPLEMQTLYASAIKQNPFLANATVLSTFGTVISSLADHNISVILDNHVSKATWCCDLSDGNGWFSDSIVYSELNSRYFDSNKWITGLGDMATWSASYANVVGMSLRNEMRPIPVLQDTFHDDWYDRVTNGAQTIHTANPNLLIMIGGVMGALDLSFLYNRPLDTSTWSNRTVWEFHAYSFSFGFPTSDCPAFQEKIGRKAGFLLESNRAFTGPLWLSEFGVGMTGGTPTDHGISSGDWSYLKCLVQYMEGNDADWSIWALQGDYYVRQGKTSVEEGFGMLDANWTGWRNPSFKDLLGDMWKMSQGP